jgi:hypothetical protein
MTWKFVNLETKLEQCSVSHQRDEALMAVKQVRQAAAQFVKDFSGLDGV